MPEAEQMLLLNCGRQRLLCLVIFSNELALLFQFCVVIAVVFILEVIAGILAFILMEHIEETLTTYLNASMIHYQDNQELRAAIDYIQRTVSATLLCVLRNIFLAIDCVNPGKNNL